MARKLNERQQQQWRYLKFRFAFCRVYISQFYLKIVGHQKYKKEMSVNIRNERSWSR